MRTIGAALQAHLDTRTTTLAWCWKVTKADASVIGFTNHDMDLVFDSTTYRADSGLSGSELEESLGLSVDNMDVEGAIRSDEISEADIAAGLYDNAMVEVWLVNWADVSQRLLMKRGRIGEITRGDYGFQAEFRSLAADFGQPVGRLYQYKCDAIVGDSRCGVDLENASFKGSGDVSSASGRTVFRTNDLGAFERDWFSQGVVTFTSGENNGRSMEVKSHGVSGSEQVIVLWAPLPFDISVGDTFTITAGCDKTFRTCKAKFNNAVNFRGFPHMPEDEIVIRYPNRGDTGLDGGGNFNGAD